jgi:hypothetical protein
MLDVVQQLAVGIVGGLVVTFGVVIWTLMEL